MPRQNSKRNESIKHIATATTAILKALEPLTKAERGHVLLGVSMTIIDDAETLDAIQAAIDDEDL